MGREPFCPLRHLNVHTVYKLFPVLSTHCLCSFDGYVMFLNLQIFDIISFIYQYLKLLRKVPPQEWIFKELQDIGNMEFRFAEEQPQDEYAAELAGKAVLKVYVDVLLGCCI